MKIAEDEYKKRKGKKSNIKIIKKEEKPEWFNQNIEENKASIDEIKALEQRIGSR